ncbi:MAG: 16S rRNA (adenine(1518)-N(6)/adenine(1519)-N(6))-dimethyltransferase RsmA [bacterium]
MSELTFRPRQSLGQNFLMDENVARKIIRTLTPNPEDVIVEIGPGFGVLTAHVLPVARRVVAVEIDRRLVQQLQTRFAGFDNLELVTGDFLKVELEPYRQGSARLRVLGNIPYHITSPVIFKVFEARQHVQDMLLMIQREVAERIVARPRCKAYGILSVFSQLYAEPEIAFHVSSNVFVPRPEVGSSVVRWDFSGAQRRRVADEALLGKIIRTCFNQRRKMLRKSLKRVAGAEQLLSQIDFDLQRRPEELSVEEFVELSNQFAEAWKNRT